jgi:DHA1 family multidrug resistance protein-like MFS transporter
MSRDLLLVVIALFTWGVGESTYRLFQPLYLEQLGASPLVIGTILGGVGIVMTLAHIPAGYLADRFGRRIIMWSAWILGIIAGAIMAAARSLPVFTFGVLLYGATGFVIAPMNSYITAARGKWSVGRAITFTGASYNLGAVFGPILGGIIGDRFGYSKMYLFATVIFAISTMVILFTKHQPTEKPEARPVTNGLLNRLFLGFLPILFLAYLGMYISQPLAPIYLQNVHNLSLSQIGSLGAISSIGTVLLSLGLGSLHAGLGFVLGQISTTFFPLLLWQGTSMTWFAMGYFMLGGFRAAGSLAVARIRSLVPTSKMGLAYGIAETTSGLAIIIAPLLAGYLYETNPAWIFQTALSLTLVSVILTVIFTRGSQTDTLEGETHE